MNYTQIQAYAIALNDSGKRQIAGFQDNINTNPKYAFEWGEGAMEGAAKVDVAAYIAEWCKRAKKGHEEQVAEAIIAHAVQETLRMASQTSQSTSHLSNAMARYTLAVWAGLATVAYNKVRFSKEDCVVVFTAK